MAPALITSGRESEDPLSRAVKPPKDETAEGRAHRLKTEAEAVSRSLEIDREIDKERVERRKRRHEIKILLLGPSCSGKSTTLKNFQLAFTPKALQAEAIHYTALIYLNVATSVRLLRDVVNQQASDAGVSGYSSALREAIPHLEAVVELEGVLTRRFGDTLSQPTTPRPRSPLHGTEPNHQPYEVTVRAGSLWKTLQSSVRRSQSSRAPDMAESDAERARLVLAEHQRDIETLAKHPSMQELLMARNQRLEHLPGYFLDDLDRITAPHYSPTDDDILRTRIRTVGVSETRFTLESGQDKGQTWVITDVGGARHQRHAWVPYFDDATAVIFVAPIGQFDQFLEEEATINCLRDSLELWDSIVSNKLLENAEFILFLNKFDMLSQKLRSGIQFSSFVTSYPDKNDAENVGRYLQRKFTAIHKQRSPKARKLHVHLTSVTDKSSTVALITHFRVVVLRSHLRETTLL